jgi:hypothetical protein
MKTDPHQMNAAMPSDRSFGWTFTGVFVLLGTWGLWQGGSHYPWVFALAAATALVTLTRARWLAPLKRGWMRLGAVLHKVVSPVVIGLMFFGLFTPMGWTMRRFGWDAMKRGFEPQAKTYWVERTPPGPAPESLKDLF